MSVIKPFTPIAVEEENGISARLVMSIVRFGGDGLPESIVADGEELLAGPCRMVGTEDGEPMIWETRDRFIAERSEEKLTVCGTVQSGQFIVNTCFRLEFDGCMTVDVKLMPRGRTVAQVFGVDQKKQPGYRVGNLILEIPLKKAELYHIYPNCEILGDGDKVAVPQSVTSCSGQLPGVRCWLPHRPFLWLGDEHRGLCIFSESDENWQPSDSRRAIEILETENTCLVRIHLLDGHPRAWGEVPAGESADYYYKPVCFSLGLEPTPIKPYPKRPYLQNALHIDCFRKIEGDYMEYLAGDFGGMNGYDRMKALGVTTLFLHEKWNKLQNYPRLTEPTARQAATIVAECHKRGIKVIPYFGYELSSLAPVFGPDHKEMLVEDANGRNQGGWWRVPPQRAYTVCCNSSYRELLVSGLKELVEQYHFDGIYLDSTLNVCACTNARHGCGYVDSDGIRRPTYPILAVRNMVREIYERIEPLGGIVNYHAFACVNIPAMGFTHLGWNGENIQYKLLKEGASSLPLDYFRAEYIGRNFGVPQEMLAYENRPKWTFEQATAFAIIHGLLPRPNSIEEPLEFMSHIWPIFDGFPFENARWVPYWENGELTTGDEDIKCSFYAAGNLSGGEQKLVLVGNTAAEPRKVKLSQPAKLLFGTADAEGNMPPFGFGIYQA